MSEKRSSSQADLPKSGLQPFTMNSKYFQSHDKTLKGLNQILTICEPDKENISDIQSHKAKSRVFRKIQTKIEKNTRKVGERSKLLLTRNPKEIDPWQLRNSMQGSDRSNTQGKRHTVKLSCRQASGERASWMEGSKRLADYNMKVLQQKCPFTRYQVYTLFSTFNAIISDSIAFKGVKLAFNAQRFIKDVATMLKVQVDIVKRVFIMQTRKKYYAVNKNFQFMDFLSFVDRVRKESLREKMNDFLNLLFDFEKDSLGYSELVSLFNNKSSQKDCENYVTKLFSILMKPKTAHIRKHELKELFEANEEMLEMFRKIIF